MLKELLVTKDIRKTLLESELTTRMKERGVTEEIKKIAEEFSKAVYKHIKSVAFAYDFQNITFYVVLPKGMGDIEERLRKTMRTFANKYRYFDFGMEYEDRLSKSAILLFFQYHTGDLEYVDRVL